MKKAGRPKEGREKLTVYVKPETVTRIRMKSIVENKTMGAIVDGKFLLPKASKRTTQD